jgi:hypothetical protein
VLRRRKRSIYLEDDADVFNECEGPVSSDNDEQWDDRKQSGEGDIDAD